MIKKRRFDEIKTLMRDNPRTEKESQSEWFLRLKQYDDKLPSRSTMNMINRGSNYLEYDKLRKSYNGKKNINKKEKSIRQKILPFEPTCDADITELSAKDKKELAMYAIDQHYFFLKQLTGVI